MFSVIILWAIDQLVMGRVWPAGRLLGTIALHNATCYLSNTKHIAHSATRYSQQRKPSHGHGSGRGRFCFICSVELHHIKRAEQQLAIRVGGQYVKQTVLPEPRWMSSPR